MYDQYKQILSSINPKYADIARARINTRPRNLCESGPHYRFYRGPTTKIYSALYPRPLPVYVS